ncbi:MAG: hypothetical protein N3A68_04650 [Bacteroidia bacterium]|nr:hypothetical protein [Bacteroidia bacterium]GIV23803.1 MAG: hypothetical protein KatS3mg025_1462 [Bacteroidia bacterium]
MRSYRVLLLRKFPENPTLGFYRHPKLPSSLLGRTLVRFLHVTSPSDVVAFYYQERLFRSYEVLFTDTHVYDKKAYYPLEDIRGVQRTGSQLKLEISQVGRIVGHTMELASELAAELMERVFELIIQAPKEDAIEKVIQMRAGLNMASVQWLELRDEVLKTIDLLHEKYQEGKLSLLEYEMLREDLLRRLV